MAEEEFVHYNLPGYGKIEAALYDNSSEVYRVLNQLGYISYLKGIDQLGALVGIYPGAHHTRYEYVVVQLSLITEVCRSAKLSENLPVRTDLTALEGAGLSGNTPSGGDLMQTMVLVGNMGHLPLTFSSERALLRFFKENNSVKRQFKYGLPEDLWPYFDECLDDFEMYRFHYLIGLFRLYRHKRREHGSEIADYCKSVFLAYSSSNDKNIKKIKNIYKGIRAISYIALDSLYAPVPYSIDISSILLSLPEYLEEFNISDSDFKKALTHFNYAL